VSLLAAVLLDLGGACSEWEDALLLAKARIQTCLRIRSAQVVLQTGLDLRSVVRAAAAGQQHCGEPHRSGQEDQANTERTFVHRLDSPAVQKGSQARERDAPVDLPIVGEGIHVAAAIRSKLRGMKTINPAARLEAVLVSLAAVYPINEWTKLLFCCLAT
jgi:hypothetical protein